MRVNEESAFHGDLSMVFVKSGFLIGGFFPGVGDSNKDSSVPGAWKS